MNLRAWLKEKNIRQSDFAEMVGITQPHVSQLVSGLRSPGIDLVYKIEGVTRGQVTLRDWVTAKQKVAAE